MTFRYLLSALGLLLALPIFALILFAVQLPVSLSGIGYLIGALLVAIGLILVPAEGKFSTLMIFIGVFALVLIAGTRLAMTQMAQTSNIRVLTLPQGSITHWFNTIIDEQDSLIFGEAIFHRIGGDSPNEHEGITAALHTAYSEMRRQQSVFASPFLGTYLNQQRAKSFDAVFIGPETMRHPDTAVIFLHGYMGNVTAQCWEIAQAVAQFGSLTVCPSTDWTGAWWEPEGQAILKATFQYLRGQGIQRFYLGGFSNGGFSISRLVSQVSKEEGLRGLIFIDGISDGASIKAAGLPVLIIQGVQDERVPATAVRPIAETIGELGTYIELDGDHFIIMKNPKPVQDAIAGWLQNQEASQ